MRANDLRKQWDDAAEGWRDFVRTQKDYYRDVMNNPATFELLGDIRRKKILDLGCGEGYNCRIMAKKGAYVTGVDFSEKMIDFAIQKEKKEQLNIKYLVAEASDLQKLKDDNFDVVVCFMSLQDIEDYEGAVKEASRVLRKDGRFVFAIPHPCFETRIVDGEVIGGWEYEKGNREEPIKEPKYYKVDRYFESHRYRVPWRMERLTLHFQTTSFHRTLTKYAGALLKAGFVIRNLKEPRPSKEAIKKYPALKGHLRIPQSIVIEAVRGEL
jgi:2-polyprenyl-3-methyl-5-hydroxy-6-metoxy-1,4-benzoquinol methylase